MSLYLVSCDLDHPHEFGTYEYLHSKLRKWRAENVLRTAWVVRSSLQAAAILESLTKLVHDDDRILVAQVSDRNWAAWKALGDLAAA
jgi:hypothetical protein